MKKELYNNTIDKILKSVNAFCDSNGVTFNRSGKYSGFIDIKKMTAEIGSEIREYIQDALGMTRRKIDKLMEIIVTKKRVYILFKVQVTVY